ncbi:TetR/AcrR family transcriptional regulator [Bradyrhizobium prioriisuperbiae]|uniref:TetR/AcrR family transcriptional regulator n=1 Tax=Bradyrhizobium prioriisuperbiae TaxID=2854389 RepID=UPI0028E69E82|nr:TetR family transcriptional regulator [Bradyrhizobium prioritasuperba]
MGNADVTSGTPRNAPRNTPRKAAVDAFKRQLIRDAAREVFLRRGLAETTLREIAKAAGSTTGAIYAQYASKEEVYGDILRQSLAELRETMQRARPAAAKTDSTARMLRAILHYYEERTAEFELGFYLKSGAARVGLGRDLDRELNAALKAVFDLVAQALIDDRRCAQKLAERRSVLLVTTVFGILLMDKTGRLATLRQEARILLEDQISAL